MALTLFKRAAPQQPGVGLHETKRLHFEPVFSDDNRYLRAFLFEFEELGSDGRPFRFFQAVSLMRVHEVKKHYASLKSLMELSDDVVSAHYDPGDGKSRIFGVHALGNILEPRIGLMQMYGARAFGNNAKSVLEKAVRDANTVRALLEGRFRQIILEPLTVEESVTWRQHLGRMKNVSSVQGIPVRRIEAAHGAMDLPSRMAAQEQQEQLEVIAAALANTPFQMMTWFDPLTFEEVSWMVSYTAQELSKWASEIKGSKSVNLSASIQSPLQPSAEYMETLGREIGGQRVAASDHVTQLADLARLRQEQAISDGTLTRHGESSYARQDHVVTQESASLQETGTLHTQETGQERLRRQSDLSWQSSVGRTIAESGTMRVQTNRVTNQVGSTGEVQDLTERELTNDRSVSDRRSDFARETYTQEQIAENQGGQEHKVVSDQYAYGESYGGSESGSLAGSRSLAGSGFDRQEMSRESQATLGTQQAGWTYGATQANRQTEGQGWQGTQALYSDRSTLETDGSRGVETVRNGNSNVVGNEVIFSDGQRQTGENGVNHQRTVDQGGQLGYDLAPQVVGAGAGIENQVRWNEGYNGYDNQGLQTEVGMRQVGSDVERWEQSRMVEGQQYGGTEQRGVSGEGSRSEWYAGNGNQTINDQTTGWNEAGNLRQTVGTENVVTEVGRQWGSQESYGDNWSRSFGGSRFGAGTRADVVDTAFDRQTFTQRESQAFVAGNETSRDVLARQIERESQTERGIDRQWDSDVGERGLETRAFSGVTNQSISESGHTSSVLNEQSQWQREVDQAFERQVSSRRYSDLSSQAEGSASEDLVATDRSVLESQARGREVSEVSTEGQRQMLNLVDGFTHGNYLANGFRMGSAPFMSASVGQSTQTYDAEKDLLAKLLEKQLERLRIAQDTGLFHTNFWLATYTVEDMEKLARTVVAAMREEDVVSPLMVRIFGKERQCDLLDHLVNLHPCSERDPTSLWQLGITSELLTSNDLGAVTHPLRIDGHGGISTTVEAIPTGLRVPTNMKGETMWGEIIAPTTGRATGSEFRVSADQLMHLTCIGGSGSGKSNAAQHVLAEIVNNLRVDERGKQIPVQVRQVGSAPVLAGRAGQPMLGATVFDPGGDWRKLLWMVDPRECRFFSLTNPYFRPLHVNPLRIPSPYIRPTSWADIVAKRWATSYATGATGFHALKMAILELYRVHGVYDPRNHHVDIEQSADVRIHDLYDHLKSIRDDKNQARGKGDITVGVIDRILEKLQAFTPESAGEEYLMYDADPGTTVDVWMPENALTILEGAFEDDNLKTFIIGLMGTACFLHARGRYMAHGNRTNAFAPHILIFEEAHEVMEAQENRSEAQSAVESGASIWNKMLDQGRKYGLHVWAIGQRLKALPEGFLSSSRITIIQSIDDADDIKLAVTKMGKLVTGMTEDLPWMRFFQRMRVGWGVVKFSRLFELREMEPVLIQFPLVGVEPPSNQEIDSLLDTASVAYAADADDLRGTLDLLGEKQSVPELVIIAEVEEKS